MKAQLTEKVKEAWPELVGADCDRNAGMPMELFSVEAYSQLDHVTPEAYIIDVLRRERERRQDLEMIASDAHMVDEQIDAAAAEGISIVEHVTRHFNEARSNQAGHVFRAEDISAFYLRKILARMEERARKPIVAC